MVINGIIKTGKEDRIHYSSHKNVKITNIIVGNGVRYYKMQEGIREGASLLAWEIQGRLHKRVAIKFGLQG